MKNAITALFVTAFALGMASSAGAATCQEIGKSVVDNYVATARYSVNTDAQTEAYNALVATQVTMCDTAVGMRKRGVDAKTAATVISTVIANNAKTVTDANGVVTSGISTMSASLGYAFGE